jgi:endonuclease/exonuclease/phosphatase (EEP) superfamily protein YafD
MRLACAVLCLVACGDSRLLQTALPAAPDAKQLRVMSYNVNFGIAGDASTITAIADARADIVFLQETNEIWEAAMVERLGAKYPHRRFDPPTDWVAGGMGVLSRFPIVKLETLIAPKAYFFAWRVVLDTPLGRIQVFNLHLRPPMSDGGSWVVGYFSTRDDRLREIQYHLEALDPKLPAILLGDFNEERENGKALALLTDERGFGDAIGQFQGDRRTWEWPVGGMTLRFQLDHILHDAHFVPTAAAIVEAGRSDHKPIWADFERIDP